MLGNESHTTTMVASGLEHYYFVLIQPRSGVPAQANQISDVDAIVRKRIEGSVDWILRSLSREDKLTLAGSIDVPQLVLRLARATPSIDPDQTDAGERLARTAEFKRNLLERAGGALTAKQVQVLLGHRSMQAVHKAASSRRLLAVDDNGTMLFPAFQFDGASVAPGIAPVLAATPTTSPWALLQFLVEGDEGLGEEPPMNLVKGGPDIVRPLVRFARTLED